MVEKIVMNLVSNALKFTPERGSVEVQLSNIQNKVQIIVKDTGVGIPDSEKSHVFERFHQVNSSSTREHAGTGIGLAIVKQFTELLQGSIAVESQLGQGTKFTVTLPIQLAPMYPNTAILDDAEPLNQPIPESINTSISLLETPPQTIDSKITGTKPLILVVDDNEDMRSYLVSLLKDTYEIVVAANGKLALEAIYKYYPQVILSDVMMPIMDGYQFTKIVKADPKIQNIPIILITAKSGKSTITSGLEVGADDYLSKPFMAEELIARTKAALRTYQNYVTLKEMNVQMAQQANLASIGQLSAGIAHEINNPITFVNNNVQVLKKYISSFKVILDEYKKYINQIEDQSEVAEIIDLQEKEKINFIMQDSDDLINESIEGIKRVVDIIKGLKTFSRIEIATQKEININECIESTLHLMHHEFKAKRVLKKELNSLPVIKCCASQVNQVIMNLLMNALQSIETEGTVTISTESLDSQVIMKVSDTGCGIPTENLEKLFNPFFTTKPIGEGTGLGLSISYGIVKQHGGDILVSSTVGKGSVFEVRLPIEGVN